MKKLLMSTAALAGLAFVAVAPARADEPALQLGLGGYVSGYAVYTDQDHTGEKFRKFDFRKDTEIHLNGEVALDNGITAGAHMELLADRADGGNTVEESYMYLSSAWGRVNFGEADGIAYLLQVGAPSADDKVDGMLPDIGTFQAVGGNSLGGTLTYAQNTFEYTNKFTYITPVFSGFQAGVSFTPSVDEGDLSGLAPSATSNNIGGALENGWEVAARYEGSFNAIDLALGAGYSRASLEASAPGFDDLKVWNVGANIGIGAFGIGASYLTSNEGIANDGDVTNWVGGVDYTTGPYKLGVSYLNRTLEQGAGVTDADIDRWTGGVVYEWGPGMTFRGAVQYQSADDLLGTTGNKDGYQVTLGTQLNF